jgi:hypothetical protein
MTDSPNKKFGKLVMTGLQGVLIISNPCLSSSRRVGRADNAWDASFAKLEQAMAIAEERKLLPIIVGDLLQDSHDIGQLLPIINLLNKKRVVLLPRNGRWQERSEGHIAAILRASGVAQVAGANNPSIQLPISVNGKLENMDLDCYTSWGGEERLEPGTMGYIKIPSMGITIMQSSGLPVIEGDETGTRIVAGRLIRLTPAEEGMTINVFAITREGFEAIPLNIMPIVFSSVAATAEQTTDTLKRDSLFVKKMRESAQSAMEDIGKESLVTLADEVCNELNSDDWIRGLVLDLAKEAALKTNA